MADAVIVPFLSGRIDIKTPKASSAGAVAFLK
jgi:hypothetical protein